jgi:hypothetical protein
MAMLHGFYSETAAKTHGTIIYNTEEGKEVEVTFVSRNGNPPLEQGYMYEDAFYVGPVISYSRHTAPSFMKLLP